MDEELKKLIEEKGKAWDAYQKVNDERVKALENREPVPAELQGKMDKINADINRLTEEIKAVEIKGNRPDVGGTVDDEAQKYNTAFGNYIRRGDKMMSRENMDILASANTGNDTEGGYLTSEEVSPIIDRIAMDTVAMRRLATITTIGEKSWKEVVTTASMTSVWVGEKTAPAEVTAPTLSQLEITPGEEYVMPYATNQMLEDGAINIEAWLAEEAGIAFAVGEGTAFITGDGVNKPRGIADYTPVANASYAWGSTGYIASGSAGAWATSDPSNALFNLYHALKPAYRTNATWLMADGTLNTIRQFQDGMGNYLWRPGLALNQPDTLLGKPIESDDNVATVTTNTLSVFFADFRRAYRIVDRTGVTVLRDPFSAKPYVAFYTRKRVGGDIKNFEAIKVLKFAAS